MEKGKQKCEELKRIRKEFADANGVDYTPSECSSTKECSGTCPKCEAEAEYIMNSVKGKIAHTGIIPGDAMSLTGAISSDVRVLDIMESSESDMNMTPGIITDNSEDVIVVDVTPGDVQVIDEDIIGNGNNEIQLPGDISPYWEGSDETDHDGDDIKFV